MSSSMFPEHVTKNSNGRVARSNFTVILTLDPTEKFNATEVFLVRVKAAKDGLDAAVQAGAAVRNQFVDLDSVSVETLKTAAVLVGEIAVEWSALRTSIVAC